MITIVVVIILSIKYSNLIYDLPTIKLNKYLMVITAGE